MPTAIVTERPSGSVAGSETGLPRSVTTRLISRRRGCETSGTLPILARMEERLVRFRPRAILAVLGIILAGIVMIEIVQAARGILIWIFVAIFFALELNPAVEGLQQRGVARRGLAVAIVFIGTIVAIAALGATIIPTIVAQVNEFIDAVPGYVEDLTAGRGRLGFL